MERDYIAIAEKYVKDVLTGEVPACRWVRLACQRQKLDLAYAALGRARCEHCESTGIEYDDHGGNIGVERACSVCGSAPYPWHFDRDKAERVCRFIELLPHIKGKWSSALLRLEPWQVFILTTVFGWVDAAGNRRYRTVYIEVPRKNGKSALSSGVALYCLCENEPGAEVYSAATKKDQARIVFDVARRMVLKSPGLARRFGVQVERHRLFVDDSAKEFKPLSSDEDGLDGLNIHCVIIDELHAHKSRAVWDVLDSATGSRSQPLIWAITTAGSNQQGVCYEQREYVIKILSGQHQDDRYFGIIYTVDLPEKGPDGDIIPGDDWKLEATWRKANPNYGVSIFAADIEALARKAMQSARSQNNFLTKRLDVWVNAEQAFYNLEAWRDCRRDVTLADFEHEPCWIGLDLSSKSDVACKARVFRRMEKEPGKDGNQVTQTHYYVFVDHYLPDAVIDSPENANAQHYSEWSRNGQLRLTPGPHIDYAVIEDDLVEDLRRFEVVAIAYDPWNCEQLRQRMETEYTAPMVENPMGVRTMSEPMKESETLVLARRLHHDGDPVLAWMMANVVGVFDNKDNVYPRKEKPEKKIDGPVAMIMALGALFRTEQKPTDFGAISL